MHHLPSLELFIRNFLTCLEVERRFSLKNGFLVKFKAFFAVAKKQYISSVLYKYFFVFLYYHLVYVG